MSRTPDDWPAVVELIEKVTAEEDLMPAVVAGVRTALPEVAVLSAADVAGHTRALLAAATRAIAARRAPHESELAFVAELATTRAGQGIGIEVVLSAIHVSERAIWARTRERARRDGVAPSLLLDARELYDDWAEAVRRRLIEAHREARASQQVARPGREEELVRRLLDGGSAAALAAAEAGLAPADGLWVLLARAEDRAGTAQLDRLARELRPSPTARIGDVVVAVSAEQPATVIPDSALGLAGPATAEEVGSAFRLALAALGAAEQTGRRGLVQAAEVAGVVAALSRPDLAAALLARHRDARRDLGPQALPVARTVRAWLEADRDTTVAARALFVHPNTVRNRLHRFAEATGIDVLGTFGAFDGWWLCQAWLAETG